MEALTFKFLPLDGWMDITRTTHIRSATTPTNAAITFPHSEEKDNILKNFQFLFCSLAKNKILFFVLFFSRQRNV